MDGDPFGFVNGGLEWLPATLLRPAERIPRERLHQPRQDSVLHRATLQFYLRSSREARGDSGKNGSGYCSMGDPFGFGHGGQGGAPDTLRPDFNISTQHPRDLGPILQFSISAPRHFCV